MTVDKGYVGRKMDTKSIEGKRDDIRLDGSGQK
jgi:hypothetical protein